MGSRWKSCQTLRWHQRSARSHHSQWHCWAGAKRLHPKCYIMHLCQKTTRHQSRMSKCQEEEALWANTSQVASHDASPGSPMSCCGKGLCQQHPPGRQLLDPFQQLRQGPPRGTPTPQPRKPTPGHSGGPSVPETLLDLRALAGPRCISQEDAAFRVWWGGPCFFQTLFWRTQFHAKSWSWRKQHEKFQPEDGTLENSQLQISKWVRRGTLWISSRFKVSPPNNLLMSLPKALLYGTRQFSRERLRYASRLKARAGAQAPRGGLGCDGTALHRRCPDCPAKLSPSSPNTEQLVPTHCGETHRGAKAGGGTVTVEELMRCQPTPWLSSPGFVCVTIPTHSEPRGPAGKRVLATR